MASLMLLKSMIFANTLRKNKKKKTVMKVKKSSLDKSKLCRICSQENGVIQIFNNLLHPNIPEEIKNISGVTIIKSDNMPDKMCKTCLDLLKGCIMFREMCQKSNSHFMEVSTSTIKKELMNSEDNSNTQTYNVPSPSFSDQISMTWECSTCSKEFLELEPYKYHLSNCSKFSDSTKVTEQPKLTERPKKRFLCDICGKTAQSRANLIVHMSIHKNVFPFKCDLCPYQGRTLDLLRVHKRSHMADKPFKCTQCPKSMTTSSNLAKHMRHVHSSNRPYKCTYCDKGFSYQHSMKKHIRDIHLRQGTVQCDICSKKFNTKKILHGHRLKIHKIRSERHGRLPSYLQCQTGNENQTENVDSFPD